MSRRALNVLEPWPTVGYLHEFIDCQTKHSLVYDLQEPFRWIADVAVMDAFECGVLDLPDFYFTGDDYRYRFEPEAKERFLDLLRERFNSGARYKDRVLKWDTVIEQKTVELGRCLTGRTGRLDFSEPSPNLHKMDGKDLRSRILSLTQGEAQKLGIGKSTFHYLRRNARGERSFVISGKVLDRLR
jgi:CRISPR-associated protein Cas1